MGSIPRTGSYYGLLSNQRPRAVFAAPRPRRGRYFLPPRDPSDPATLPTLSATGAPAIAAAVRAAAAEAAANSSPGHRPGGVPGGHRRDRLDRATAATQSVSARGRPGERPGASVVFDQVENSDSPSPLLAPRSHCGGRTDSDQAPKHIAAERDIWGNRGARSISQRKFGAAAGHTRCP